MKKLIPVLMIAVLVSLSACTPYMNYKPVDEGNFSYKVTESGSEAMAVCYSWDRTEEGLMIDIPGQTEEGVPVKKVGGYIGTGVPTAFGLTFSDKTGIIDLRTLKKTEEDDPAQDDGTEPVIVYKDVTFTINIGKDVDLMIILGDGGVVFKNNGFEQEDGSILVYRATIEINLDPENKNYHIENGEIFDKNGNKWKFAGR